MSNHSIRRVLATGISLAVLAALAPTAAAQADGDRPSDPRSRGGEGAAEPPALAAGVIVTLRAGADATSLRRPAARALAVDGVRARTLTAKLAVLDAPELMPLTQAEDAAREIAQRADVVSAEPNLVVWPTATTWPTPVNDPAWPLLRNLWDTREANDTGVMAVGATPWPAGGYGTKAPSLWRATKGRPTVTVAVVDTGVRPNHPDLAGQLVPGYDFVASTLSGNDGGGWDPDPSDPGDWTTANLCYSGQGASNSSWHGSHVAGTVAATGNNGIGVVGVAPGVRMQAVRVLGRCGGTTADVMAGMLWSAGVPVTGAPANATPAKVINMSLGGTSTCSATFAAAVNSVRARGASVMVAAGNANAPASTHFPANCPGVVTVGAVTDYGDRAWYSNNGPEVEVSAPGGDDYWDGVRIYSTIDTGTTTPVAPGYAYYQGTSMATPAVAGGAALLASLGTFSPSQMEVALQSAVTAFPTSSNPNWLQCSTAQCGAGILDLTKVPAPVAAPAVSGTARVGKRLTTTAGSWIGPGTPLLVRWLSNGNQVGTGSSYTLKRSDSGHTMSTLVGPSSGAFTPIVTRSGGVSVARLKTPKVKLKAPSRVRAGSRPVVKVVIKVGGIKKPTGKITIVEKRGNKKKKLGKVTLKKSNKGTVKLRLKKLKKGKHKIRAVYRGNLVIADGTSRWVKIRAR